MNTADIKSGDKVEINVKTLKNVDTVFTTTVENVIDANHIRVQAPIHCGKLVKFNIDSSYNVLLVTDRGVMSLTAIPVKYLKFEGFNYLIFRVETEGTMRQRREHFRFACELPFKLTDLSKTTTSSPIIDATTRDISAGGMKFDSNAEIALSSKVLVKLMLHNELFTSNGKVLYKRSNLDSDYKYEYRLSFVAILDSEKDKIIQYVFNEQRNTLKIKK